MKIAGALSILFIFIFLKDSNAQNIVPNYSFEQADSCPTNFNNRTYKYSLGCVEWGQATTGTADYYNNCDSAAISIERDFPIMGVPHNAIGFQEAYEGVAYAGIGMYDSLLPNYKEYLISTIPPLQIDTIYKVSIEVSLADSSRFATEGFGVLFTTYGSPNQSSLGTLDVTPQIDYTTYGVILDTIHWTTLSSTFIADSNYTNLIIGGFKQANDMHIIAFNGQPKKSTPYTSYYYIDNIVVEKLSSSSIAYSKIDDKVSLCPNPFSDYTILSFDNPDKHEYTLRLFNAQGQNVLFINKVVSEKIRIERNNIPAGVYYYQLRSEYKVGIIGKLIVR
jgi:Secretion system C-terminal sorting domain